MTVSACLWLGLFPLLQFGTFSSITRDKWIIMFILSGVTLAGFIADCICRRVSRPRLLPLLLGGILLLWTLVSCLLCSYPGTPWWIGTGRREGLATQLCYFGIFFLFSFSRVRRTPVIISVVMFIIYYIIDNTGYKMAREALWPCWAGMWLSSFVLLPIGIFLTYKAATDSALFNPEAWMKMLEPILKKLKGEN